MIDIYLCWDGTSMIRENDDFDAIVNFNGRGYKHLPSYDMWFDAETRKEVKGHTLINILKSRYIVGGPQCYRNLTFHGYEFVPKGESYMDVLTKIAGLIYTPTIKKIIVNDKTTIVLWEDGTKTIVRPSEHDAYDLEAAVCAAIAKKIYGTNSAFKRMIREKVVVQRTKRTREILKEKKDE